MKTLATARLLVSAVPLRAAAGLALALVTSACGGALTSGVAVGKVGHGLSTHADAGPPGGRACTVHEALTAPAGAPEKPTSDACLKAQRNDRLWQRSLVVLAAYGDTLESMASGVETAGRLEAAQTGVSAASLPEVDGAPEQAAKGAIVQLVDQMNANASKGDVAKTVQEAGPRVKTICDGLIPY